MNPFILHKPIITEKTYALAKEKVYTFGVNPLATKGQIKDAVESTFGVKVLSVQTAKQPGGTKRTGQRRMMTEVRSSKRAYVRIPKDQVIEVFEIDGQAA